MADNERWEMFDKVGAAMILIQAAKDCVECSKILQFFELQKIIEKVLMIGL